MRAALPSIGLGHVVDFVPNHMGIGTGRNARWNDVLENGPSSPAAAFFDIEWTPETEELHAKLLLPILGDQYGRVLERGELRSSFRDGQLTLVYFDTELPINPRQSPRVFKLALEPLTAFLGPDNPALHEFQSIITSLQKLPPYTEQRPELMAERQREKDVARTRLARLVAETRSSASRSTWRSRGFNGEPGRPESFDQLHELLESQPYRLAYWRTASHEINYRRFFDVNTLAGLRVERPGGVRRDPQAARDAAARRHRRRRPHRSSRRAVRAGALFRDAAGRSPRDALGARARRRPTAAAPRPLYVVAEKSSRARSRCRRAGRCTARPATTT